MGILTPDEMSDYIKDEELKAQRDELLAACKEAQSLLENEFPGYENLINQLSRAIARAEGKGE